MTTYRDYTTEEIGQRGEALYAERIRPLVEDGNKGRLVTMDIETGDYELGDDILVLTDRLHAKRPEAPLYSVRIGHRTVGRIGGPRRVSATRENDGG